VSVMLGALVLLERLDRDPPWHAVVACASLGLALLGAVVVSSAHEKVRDDVASEPQLSPA